MRGSFVSEYAVRALSILSSLIFLTACDSLIKQSEHIQETYIALHGGANPGGGGNPPAPGTPCTPPTVGSVTAVYPAAANWLQYVRNDSVTPFLASGTPCNGTETGHYNSCLHGGEMRKVVVSNRSSCAGLTATDTLAAFKWRCEMQSGSPTMVTGGLDDEKFLSHLIDFSGAGAFRLNAITVSDACGSATTASTSWYTNTIVKDFTTGTVPSLATSNVIYIYTVNPAKRLAVAANSVAVVSQPGLIMTGPAGAYHLDANGRNFTWFETTLNSTGMTLGSLQIAGAKFCVVRGANLSSQQMTLSDTHSCRIGFTRLFDATIHFDGGSDNLGNFFHDISIANGYVDHQFVSTSNDIFVNLTSHNAAYGFSTGNGPSMDFNIVINHTAANIDTDGLRGNTIADSTFMNILYVNIYQTAYLPQGNRNTVINFATAHSQNGIYAGGDYDYFSGLLRVGATGSACLATAANPGFTAACAANAASDFTFSNTINLNGSMVGKVLVDDTANTQDTNGLASFAAITDFFNFESRFRGWGVENAAAAFDPLHRGKCSAGNCRIWDLRPLVSDTQVRGVLVTPDANLAFFHRWQAANSTECGAIKDAVWQDTVCSNPGYFTSGTCAGSGGTWQTSICSTRALRHAYEILNDARGNDNGLCETGEACIHTPNIGSYQGHGQLNFIGNLGSGLVSNVDLYRYQSNGL